MTLVARIQSNDRGMRMKRYSPVGDQTPSLAQFVSRSPKSRATPSPAQLSQPGIIAVRRRPTEAARKKTALGTAASTSIVHVRSKSALVTPTSPERATE